MPDPIEVLARAAADARAGKLIDTSAVQVYGTSYYNAEALIVLLSEAVVRLAADMERISNA